MTEAEVSAAARVMESRTVEEHIQEMSLPPSSTELLSHGVSLCFPGQPNVVSLEAAFPSSSSASFLVNVVDRGVFLLPIAAWGARDLLECLGLHTGVLTDAHFTVEPGPKRV